MAKNKKNLLIALAIAGVALAGGVIGWRAFVLPALREHQAMLGVVKLKKAVKEYHAKHGQFPLDLTTLCKRESDGSAALLDPGALTDPWDQPYIYEPGNVDTLTGLPHIYSMGPPSGYKGLVYPQEGANQIK